MRADPTVVCLGEDIGAAEGVFKTTVGLFKEFGATRVWDTPISEQAIVGAALGAAMTGMRPVAEIMFSDFIACCYDYLANEIPKMRYMTGGQVTVPLVIRTANGGGLGFGAQHSQAVENWVFTVPGLKIVAPSNPADVVGLMASAIRSDDPVIFFEHKGLFASKGEPAPPGHVVPLGEAVVARAGTDVTLWRWPRRYRLRWRQPSSFRPKASRPRSWTCGAWCRLTCRPCWPRWSKTSRLVIVEENPYQGGWGGTVASIVADEGFESLDAPIRRVAAACVPLPFADVLEDEVIPTVAKVVDAVRRCHRLLILLAPMPHPLIPRLRTHARRTELPIRSWQRSHGNVTKDTYPRGNGGEHGRRGGGPAARRRADRGRQDRRGRSRDQC